MHSDRGMQFESNLYRELCAIWGVDRSRTTPYHPQGNGVVERGNRTLGDSLRTLLLGRAQEDWDVLLPSIMRTFRATPHTTTAETPNLLMLGRETRLPDHTLFCESTEDWTIAEYTKELLAKMDRAHALLRDQQLEIRTEDAEEPPLFQPGDLVLMRNFRRKRGQCQKLVPKYVGPYVVQDALPNHTYRVTMDGKSSVQNEQRLKLFRDCRSTAGRAPVLREPIRRPVGFGRTRRSRSPSPEEGTIPWLADHEAALARTPRAERRSTSRPVPTPEREERLAVQESPLIATPSSASPRPVTTREKERLPSPVRVGTPILVRSPVVTRSRTRHEQETAHAEAPAIKEPPIITRSPVVTRSRSRNTGANQDFVVRRILGPSLPRGRPILGVKFRQLDSFPESRPAGLRQDIRPQPSGRSIRWETLESANIWTSPKRRDIELQDSWEEFQRRECGCES